MTTKLNVSFERYKKRPRLLAEPMIDALGPGRDLYPILEAVTKDQQLRLDIRDHRFNVYFGGGNLMLVEGRTSPWAVHFDKKYFKGGDIRPPKLPSQFSTIDDTRTWVSAFPALIAAMEAWWSRNPKGERAHCQAMAVANSGMAGLPQADYLVLDIEYQWAQRRFDLVAARRRPTESDRVGWAEPDLVFVEVKSEYGACSGTAGLGDHARDYQSIITARGGQCTQDIKSEYENVIAQKVRLGLLNPALGFRRFSSIVPELLVVFVNIKPNDPKLMRPLSEIKEVSDGLGDAAHFRFMRLCSPDYVMTTARTVSQERLAAANT